MLCHKSNKQDGPRKTTKHQLNQLRTSTNLNSIDYAGLSLGECHPRQTLKPPQSDHINQSSLTHRCWQNAFKSLTTTTSKRIFFIRNQRLHEHCNKRLHVKKRNCSLVNCWSKYLNTKIILKWHDNETTIFIISQQQYQQYPTTIPRIPSKEIRI